MPGTTLGLLLLIAASGALHIHAEYKGPRRRVYLFKPLTMLLIIGLAYINPAGRGGFYRSAILLGLAISLVGDIFLMLPGNRVLAGLASFFAAHLVYIAAFATGRTTDIAYLSAIPFYLYALLYYVAISPRLDRLRYPVLAYVIVIATMST